MNPVDPPVTWLRSLGHQAPGLLAAVILVMLFLHHLETVAVPANALLGKLNDTMRDTAVAVEHLSGEVSRVLEEHRRFPEEHRGG